ncbi:hypothetical protein [Stigmatella hybrida]|uniref:hypothetical protein n=1 Tax=Stigmatella hybrida TaxID=394097 RepID=UPI001CDA93C5|nr:hypothetical protein [Stigmatella hybrida]
MPFVPADLNAAAYWAGNFVGGAVPPALADAAGNAWVPGTVNPPDHHFILPAGVGSHFSHHVGALQADHHRVVNFGALGAANQSVFLEFYPNQITSCRLPAGGLVSYFFTAQLSGCAIFVDQLPAGDVIVYHANAMRFSLPQAQAQAQPLDYETPNAVNYLNALHAHARAHYPGAVNLGSTFKSAYNAAVATEAQRKRNQLRSNVDFVGGTSVFGFKVAGVWEFYYQTWGYVTYRRPFWKGLGDVAAGTNKQNAVGGPMRIFDVTQFV